MARRTITLTIDKGRDADKHFVITEMSATQAELWAWRAFLAASKSGLEIPEEIANEGMAGIAMMGIGLLGKIPFDEAKPLLDDMLACVQIQPNPNNPAVLRALIESDIEEISTLLKLRAEVFKLHVDFLQAANAST